MPVVGIREFGRKISEMIARVEAGEAVIITRHGRPTAAILPLAGDRVEALTVAAAPQLIKQASAAVEQHRAGEGRSLDDLLELAQAEAGAGARAQAGT